MFALSPSELITAGGKIARSKAALFSVAIAAAAFASSEAKAQTAPNLPEIVARDLGANGVLTPEPRIPGSPVREFIQPFSIVVTGDGQIGIVFEPGAPAAPPEITTDGRSPLPENVLDQDDPVANSLQ